MHPEYEEFANVNQEYPWFKRFKIKFENCYFQWCCNMLYKLLSSKLNNICHITSKTFVEYICKSIFKPEIVSIYISGPSIHQAGTVLSINNRHFEQNEQAVQFRHQQNARIGRILVHIGIFRGHRMLIWGCLLRTGNWIVRGDVHVRPDPLRFVRIKRIASEQWL